MTTLQPGTSPGPSSPARPRLEGIDALRGFVMILMALDHSRDFFSNSHAYFDPLDLTQSSTALFLTRWVTDFCAPVFCFLAGVGASFSAGRGRPTSQVAYLLVTRGLWLIFLELAVIRVFWYFNFDFTLLKAGVIWCLGWSMVALGGLIYLPRVALFVISVVMIFGHNLLDGLGPDGPGFAHGLWTVMHGTGYLYLFGSVQLLVVYPLIPWIGLMALGFLAGPVTRWEQPLRRRWIFLTGLGLTVGFAVLRGLNGYGDPNPWVHQETAWFTFLNMLACEKYPPSLAYLLMTMGPALMFLALLDRPTQPGFLRPVVVFGRVPFLFYVLHLPLLHAMAIPWAIWRYGDASWLFANPPATGWPHDFHFDLPLTYAAWIVAVLLLYPVCRWFANYKATHKSWWLSYL